MEGSEQASREGFRGRARRLVKRVTPPSIRDWARTVASRLPASRREPRTPPFRVSRGEVILGIDESWSNDWAIGLRGWALTRTGPLDGLVLEVDGTPVPITAWHARPDITATLKDYRGEPRCGFNVHLPRVSQHRLTFTATQSGHASRVAVRFSGARPIRPVFSDVTTLFNEFITTVNENHLRVLEIGSRIVSPGSASKRVHFHGAAAYIGFDYYPDANTDVVGDAHRLSEYFAAHRFDAVFSISVLEHIAMPWVLAREINKVLEIGGLTFHATHFAWPMHAMPWNFWRFSDEGLKVLLSSPVGFETVKAGLFHPARLHPDALVAGQEGMALAPGFCGTAILAKKVAEVADDTLAWDTEIDEVVGESSRYPLDA